MSSSLNAVQLTRYWLALGISAFYMLLCVCAVYYVNFAIWCCPLEHTSSAVPHTLFKYQMNLDCLPPPVLKWNFMDSWHSFLYSWMTFLSLRQHCQRVEALTPAWECLLLACLMFLDSATNSRNWTCTVLTLPTWCQYPSMYLPHGKHTWDTLLREFWHTDTHLTASSRRTWVSRHQKD